MKCEFIKIKGTWKEIKDSCLTTIGKKSNKEPDSNFKKRLLLSEHSPIRQLIIKAKFIDLKSWVSIHIIRHKHGIEHWVRTQRTDRTNIDRDKLPQDSLVDHEIEANAQAMINISRKRLCAKASNETRLAWSSMLDTIKDIEPELYSVCVPECIYRGFCPEFETCGFSKTRKYDSVLEKYRSNIN
jgi:hypothetical protein